MAKRKPRVRKVNTKNWGQRGTSVPLAATIQIPSGRCPFIMEDSCRESVLQWIALVTHNKHENLTYNKSVYEYWVRHSFDMNSSKEDHKAVIRLIQEVVPEKTRRVSDLMFSAEGFLEG